MDLGNIKFDGALLKEYYSPTFLPQDYAAMISAGILPKPLAQTYKLIQTVSGYSGYRDGDLIIVAVHGGYTVLQDGNKSGATWDTEQVNIHAQNRSEARQASRCYELVDDTDVVYLTEEEHREAEDKRFFRETLKYLKETLPEKEEIFKPLPIKPDDKIDMTFGIMHYAKQDTLLARDIQVKDCVFCDYETTLTDDLRA